MKNNTAILALLLLCLVVSSQAIPQFVKNFLYGLDGFREEIHKFGASHFHRKTDEGTEHHIYFPKGGLFSEKEHYEQLFEAHERAKTHPEEYDLKSEHLLSCDRGAVPEYWKFFGQTAGILNA